MRLAFRLADAKGCTVEQLGQVMGSDEFIMWAAYDQLSPIGPDRLDYLAARMMALVATMWGSKKHNPADFMPPWSEKVAPKKRGSTNAEIIAYFKAIEADQKRKKARQ